MGGEVAFECARCGKCCSQRLILLNTEDVFRMAERLQLPVPKFMEKYGVVFAKVGDSETPRLYLQIVLTTAGTGLLLLIFVRPIKKLAQGVK